MLPTRCRVDFTNKVNPPLLEWFIYMYKDHGKRLKLLSLYKFLALLRGSDLSKHISKEFGPEETSFQNFMRSSSLAVVASKNAFVKLHHYFLQFILCKTQEQDVRGVSPIQKTIGNDEFLRLQPQCSIFGFVTTRGTSEGQKIFNDFLIPRTEEILHMSLLSSHLYPTSFIYLFRLLVCYHRNIYAQSLAIRF